MGIGSWKHTEGSIIEDCLIYFNGFINNGVPSGRYWRNIVVAPNDKEDHNIARNIKLIDNVLYHDIDFLTKQNSGNVSSLALGFIKQFPVTAILLFGNIVRGKNNAFSVVKAASSVLNNNLIYSGYDHIYENRYPIFLMGKLKCLTTEITLKTRLLLEF